MALERFEFAPGTAIVTGAASGMGEQLAYSLADRGSSLALVDRDAARLDKVAATVRARTTKPVATYVVDLADDEATRNLGGRLAAGHPDTRLLINNAGVALAGSFDQVSAEEFDWLLAVNLRAVVTLTRALLPTLRARPGAHLVNVSSVFGLIAPAGQVAYSTSKYAVRGFTEALRAELYGHVGVTVVHPGGVRTRIAENARISAALTARAAKPDAEPDAGPDAKSGTTRDSERGAKGDSSSVSHLLNYPADRAAERILDAVSRRRPRLLIGSSARLPDLLTRASPSLTPVLLDVFRKRTARGN
ncbi:SDR family NAD(P)-dependent oxidoreductase [Streptomyces sp. NPDC090306]|uniref:SDR family NAD(P)-dependent oxidoreductase n=1 Tax=Streptomyces sp. NPDC090306 TaxID=3365961 RepID=UPI0038054BBC